MSPNELRRRFPNAKADFIRLNSDAPHLGRISDPLPQRRLQKDPLVESGGKEKSPGRPGYRVTITSRRVTLTDPDNLTPKFLIDALRYQGLIPDDSPDHIILELRQEKVAHKKDEGTAVVITQLSCP